ncbi:MAG: imidazolonepropionase, partial [bacterium]
MVTPGLIDCHTHLVFGGDRSTEFEARCRGASYRELAEHGGGIWSSVCKTRARSQDLLLKEARPRALALLREGVTTIEIKSGYGLDVPTELKLLAVARRLGQELGVNVFTTLLAAHALPPEYEIRRASYIDLICTQMPPAAMRAGLVDAVDVFCETIAFSRAECATVLRRARCLGIPVKVHADQLSDGDGAALAAHFDALSADHLEWTNAAGVEAMAAAGTVAVLLPVPFLSLRDSRRPPIDLLRRHGVPIAIATDCNPGSSPCTSHLATLPLSCALFGLTPEEALAGVTRAAARALGVEASRGTLQPGKHADFALWNIEHPRELSYWLGGNPCVGVVINGEPWSA